MAVKQAIASCVAFAWEWLAAQHIVGARASVMVSHTAEGVAQLFQEERSALDTYGMNRSDDELGMEEEEVLQNPEFEDFEEIEGIIL